MHPCCPSLVLLPCQPPCYFYPYRHILVCSTYILGNNGVQAPENAETNANRISLTRNEQAVFLINTGR